MNPILDILLRCVAFILLFVGFYLLMQSVSLMETARKNMQKIMRQLHDKGEKRVAQIELERRRYGSVTGSGRSEGTVSKFLLRIDNKLVYSEVSVKFPWLNASVYLIGTVMLFGMVFIAGALFLNMVIVFALAILVAFAPYAYISHLANANYQNTETQLKFFVNLIASNAAMSGDLVTVLEMSAPYVANPIRGAIDRALATAKLSQQPDDAIWQLTREIEHPLFTEFIHNLDISAKHESDFRSVAKDFSSQVDQSLKALERQKAIFKNSRSEILTMIIMGVLLLFMAAGFGDKSLFAVFKEMTQSIIGSICLFLEAVIFGSAIIYLFVGRRR